MIVCARCGAQNQPTNKFCLSCGAPVQQVGQPAPAAPNPPAPAAAWSAPAPIPAQGQWGPPHQPEAAPPAWGQPQQPAPQQPWGQPAPLPQQPQPAWGQQPPAPQQNWGQPQPNAPQPSPSAWGAQPAPQPAANAWQQNQPQGGFAPAGAFNPTPAHLRVGSPEGLNPFGATVGPNPSGPTPNPQPAPAWPGEAAFAPTAPPTPDELEQKARAAAPAYSSPPAQAPAPQPPPAAPAPATRPSTHPAAGDPEALDPNAPRALAGFLVSYEGNELGVFYPIHQGQNLVGRKGAAPGLNIELEHGTTSSRHATLFATARPGRVKIEDVGSTNGTFVGDLMLERGKKHELKDGDVVRFGGYVTIVKIV